jgi:hypothetical protein
MTGTSVAAIIAAVSGDVVITGSSLEALAALIVTIKNFIGC